MKAVIFALVGAAAAALEERQVDPLSASLAVLSVLPVSLQEMAITNPAAVASQVSAEFATGTPTWFTQLPTDVQSYFLSQASAGATPSSMAASSTADMSSMAASMSAAASSSASAASESARASITSSLAAVASSAAAVASSASAALSSAAASGSSAASGSGAMPTQVALGGLAGVAGLMGLLAL